MAAFLSRWFKRPPAPRPPDYYERRTEELLHTLLPAGRGAAQTIQGELIRHAHHLFDDGYRRGFSQWPIAGEAAVAFLRRHLVDPRVFDAAQNATIREALDRVTETAPHAGVGLPLADLRVLLYRAVDWCDRNPAPQPLQRDRSMDV